MVASVSPSALSEKVRSFAESGGSSGVATGHVRHARTAFCIIITYSLVLKLEAAAAVSLQTQARHLTETSCHLHAHKINTGIAEIGHQRRKSATVLLRTDISDGQGLTNQHVNLVSLITLALAGDVDKVLLPKHKHRSHFSLGASWQEGPTQELWDIHSIKQLLKDRGVGMLASLKDLHSTVY